MHQISQEHKAKQSTWSDEIATMWNDRGIKFHKNNSSITKITSNKTKDEIYNNIYFGETIEIKKWEKF